MQSLNEPRLPPPLVGVSNASLRRDRRIPLRVESLIQLVAESYSEGPLPGLSEVVEVRPASEEAKEIAYLCNLCEAQCVPNSIMKHLTGFKHYLRCLETIDTISYEKYRFSPKKVIEGRVRRILLDYERRRGRGIIRVEQEVDDLCSMSGEPGPSWKNIGSVPSTAASADGFDDSEFVSAMEHLDTSMSDFHCRACDAHMNNKAMWESHVRGKRHLKNVKKVPGENTSKVKSYHCPEETAHLMSLLELEGVDEYNEPYLIVGLDFIKETQNEAGDLYNCFLCGACTSSYDIIEHLIQPKHKVKYLETLNARGCENFIENIKSLSDVSARSKECMIDEECRNALQKYGEGKVAVYRSKNIYASSSYAGSHSSRY
nr:uncharacterized protein LOC122271674 [Parasteatoda tepidariorum]